MKDKIINITSRSFTDTFLLKLILVVLIALISLIDMKDIMTIHIATDEFGYWTAAADFVGFDWSECASLNTYYSFGYGLVLAPLLLLIKNPIDVYKLALILNVFFIQLSFLLLCSIFENISEKISSKKILLICFSVSCYASNVFNTKLTLSECFLWFLFIAIAWLLKRYLYSNSFRCLIGIIILSGFIFMVHMRTIVVFFAICIVLGINYYKRYSPKKGYRAIIGFILILFLLLGIEEYIKGLLINAQYANTNETVLAMNDFNGQASKLKSLISINGVISFIANFLGRIFYLGYSTFLITYFGFYHCIKKVFDWYKGIYSKWHYFCIFILLSIIFALGISSLYMIYLQDNRQDILYYGRYNEYLIAPILIIGIIELITNQNRKKLLFMFCGIQLILTLLISVVIKEYNMTTPLDASIPALYYWLKKNNFHIYSYFSASLLIILIAIFLCFIVTKLKFESLKVLILIITVSCCWIHLGHNSYAISDTHKHDEAYNDVYEVIRNNLSETTDCFYCFNESDKENTYYFMGIDRIQFMLKDEIIYFKNIEFYDDIPVDSIIVIRTKSDCLNDFVDMPKELLKSDEFIVYQK